MAPTDSQDRQVLFERFPSQGQLELIAMRVQRPQGWGGMRVVPLRVHIMPAGEHQPIERGHSFARRVWDGAEYLPTMKEIRQPELWLARIDYMDGRIAQRAPAEGRLIPENYRRIPPRAERHERLSETDLLGFREVAAMPEKDVKDR